jgi:DNA-binding winged helix-turn-helix (wHTH) protein
MLPALDHLPRFRRNVLAGYRKSTMSAEPIDTALPFAIAPEGAPAPIDLTEPFYLGDWRIDPPLRRASKGERVVKIDPRNLRVLQILAERRGQLVSQREIETLAWEGVIVTPDSLYQSIRQLRQALGDTKSPAKYIETVPRRGYRLVAEVVGLSASLAECAENNPAPDLPSADQHSETAAVFAGAHERRQSLVLSRTVYLPLIAIACLVLGSLSHVKFAPHRASGVPELAGGKYPANDPERMDVQGLWHMGRTARIAGHPREALAYFQDALGRQMIQSGEHNATVADLLVDIASAHFWLDDDTAARSAAMRAVSILEKRTPASSPERIDMLRTLSEILVGAGEYDEAGRVLDDALALGRQHLGESHLAIAGLLSIKALLRHAEGSLQEAERLARQAREMSVRLRGVHSIYSAYIQTSLSAILIDMGKAEEAEAELRSALNVLKQVAGEDHPYVVSCMHLLAEALLLQGSYGAAAAILHEELSELGKQGSSDWRVARAASTLGEVLLATHKLVEAEKYLSIAKAKLTGTKGWPIARENRNLERRLRQLADMRVKQDASTSTPDSMLTAD